MSSSKESERLRLLLLLQQGVNVQNLTLIPPRPIYKASVSQATIDKNMAKAYPNFSRHDWGPFGEYEYLGPGTDYSGKANAGVKPKNKIDELAMIHDSQYEWTDQELSGSGMGVPKSIARGLSDYGAGAAMMTAAFNPWENLSFGDRVLGYLAGTALMMQGTVRISPVGWTVGPLVDMIFY